MVDVDPGLVIEEVDLILEALFLAEDRLKRASLKFEDQQRAEAIAHHAAIAPTLAEIDKLGAQLDALIAANRTLLIKRGRKGFATDIARLVLERTSSTSRVTDPALVMERARKEGITREISVVNHEWRFDLKKFSKFLRWHRKYRSLFEDLIFRPVSKTRWHIEPKSTYTISSGSGLVMTPDAVTVEVRELAPR